MIEKNRLCFLYLEKEYLKLAGELMEDDHAAPW